MFWSFSHLPWPFTVLAIYLHGTFYGFFGGGTGGHELSHRTVFRSRLLNEFFIRFLGFFTYLNFAQFRGNHTRHHLHTTQPDIDLEVMLPLPYNRWVWIWGFTLNIPGMKQIFPALLSHCFGRPGGISKQARINFPSKDPKDTNRMIRWAWTMLLGHLALAAIFIATGNWILIFLVTLAPFIGRWFFVLTHRPQHIGMQGEVFDWRRNTRTYLAGWFIRFIYWNMNFHIEHHMYAAVPYYHLPALHRAIKYDLPIPPAGLRATWRQIFTCLKKQRTDPMHYVKPEFPPTANLEKE